MQYQLTGYCYYTLSPNLRGKLLGEIEVNQQDGSFTSQITDHWTNSPEEKVRVEGRFVKIKGLTKLVITETNIAHDTELETRYILKKRGIKNIRGTYKGYWSNRNNKQQKAEISIF